MAKLKAPESYWKLSDEEKNKMLNKCGPDGPLNSVVPNHLLGLDISESCQIHDFTFINAKSEKEHRKSDKLFLSNMKKTIDSKTRSKPLKTLRNMVAYIYYGAVRVYSYFS